MSTFVLAFAIIAAAATVVRAVSTTGQRKGQIPTRTLAVNVAGSAVLGLLIGRGWNDNTLMVVALLGSVTTFSSVLAESAELIEDRRRRQAVAYVGLTIVMAVVAAWVGIIIGETL